MTAISYSKKINGKQAILVGCPTGGSRARGRIFTFLVDSADNSITLFSEFAVPDAEGGYVYSCLTEMEDGTIALLWELNRFSEGISILFDKFSILDIAPNAAIEGASVKVRLEQGGTYTRTYSDEGEFLVTKEADAEIAEITTESSEGNKVVSITGMGAGYTEAVIDGMIYEIYVSDNTIYLPADSAPYVIEDVASEPGKVLGDAVEVTREADGAWKLFGHVSGQENSLNSFSDKSNSQSSLSEAEFTFTGSGTTYSIYNEATNTYLKNKNINTFFEAGRANMTVTPAAGKFRINSQEGWYVIFYTKQMNFNANSQYQLNYGDGSYELELLEKQDSVSEGDVIPGYKSVTSITSGKKYLIAYRYDYGSVILLYPKNGTSNQTKLARHAFTVKIMPKQVGEASVVIDGTTYRFKITTPGCKHETTVTKGEIKANCLGDGYTGDTYCADSGCGKLLEKGSAVLASGSHAWGEPEVVKEVTETENGELVYTCRDNPFHKKTETVYAYGYQALKEAYERASELIDDLIYYEQDGALALQDAYESSKKIINSQGADSASIIRAAEALEEAIASLALTSDAAAQMHLKLLRH